MLQPMGSTGLEFFRRIIKRSGYHPRDFTCIFRILNSLGSASNLIYIIYIYIYIYFFFCGGEGVEKTMYGTCLILFSIVSCDNKFLDDRWMHQYGHSPHGNTTDWLPMEWLSWDLLVVLSPVFTQESGERWRWWVMCVNYDLRDLQEYLERL